jgi:hypothetical protein
MTVTRFGSVQRAELHVSDTGVSAPVRWFTLERGCARPLELVGGRTCACMCAAHLGGTDKGARRHGWSGQRRLGITRASWCPGSGSRGAHDGEGNKGGDAVWTRSKRPYGGTALRACASDVGVKFPAEHDGTAGKDRSGKDGSAAPAFRARYGVCWPCVPTQKTQDFGPWECTCEDRLNWRTEGFGPVCVLAMCSHPEKARLWTLGVYVRGQVVQENRGVRPLGCTCECVPNDGGATV